MSSVSENVSENVNEVAVNAISESAVDAIVDSKWMIGPSNRNEPTNITYYYRVVSDYLFSFIGYYKDDDGGDAITIKYQTINLRDYSINELQKACSNYYPYPTIEEIIWKYGIRDGLRVVADCVFRSTRFDLMNWISFSTEQEAINFVQRWMKWN